MTPTHAQDLVSVLVMISAIALILAVNIRQRPKQ